MSATVARVLNTGKRSNGTGSNGELLKQIRRSLLGRDPIDDAERVSIARTLSELDRREDLFDQNVHPVHITGSAIVVGVRGVVLLKHKRLGLWLQPGGHIDAGETPWDGALREAREETGLDVAFAGTAGVPELVHVDVHAGGRGHTHLDLRYLVVAGDTDPAPPDGESQEIDWFDWPSAIERASDDRLRSLLRHLAA